MVLLVEIPTSNTVSSSKLIRSLEFLPPISFSVSLSTVNNGMDRGRKETRGMEITACVQLCTANVLKLLGNLNYF